MLKRLLAALSLIGLLTVATLAAGPIFVDRVQDTSTTSGTTDFALAGTPGISLQAWSTVGNGNTAYYLATDTAGNWEVGLGTYSSTGPTLARTTVLSSSTGSKVSFPAGTKTVSLVTPAAWDTGPLPVGNGGTGLTSLGTGIATWLGTPSSANLASAITDETGSGALAFATSPTLVTPTLGVATATSVNKVAITAPATSATLAIADGKTLTASNSLTLAGTDATTQTFPSTSASIARTDAAQTFTGSQSFATAPLNLSGSSSGQIVFPSTQNASANVSTLDDYKEGTFTPILNFGGATTGITYGAQTGTYTKVGNLVSFSVTVALTSKGSATGNATITGMPFTSNGGNFAFAFEPNGATFASLTAGLMAYMLSSATALNISVLTSTGDTPATNTNFTNTSTFRIAGSYSAL
jgi:hypothetical protein